MKKPSRTRRVVGKRAAALIESFLGGDSIARLAKRYEVNLEAVLPEPGSTPMADLSVRASGAT